MNLIAKEYVAVHADRPGMLVLSEMAGAARELPEALIVNPHDEESVAEAIHAALTMPTAAQVRCNTAMRRRLSRYDVHRWTDDFLGKLDEVMMRQLAYNEYLLTDEARLRLLQAFGNAKRRLLLLDYDGTLVPFAETPEQAAPDDELLGLLRTLAADERNTLVLVSGRERTSLEEWFGELDVALAAEHGAWIRELGGEWATASPMTSEWKEQVRALLEKYVDRTPGSFAEEKDYSLAWHYRTVPVDLARRRLSELTEALAPIAQALGLSLLDGNRVLEVKPSGVDKGSAAHRWMGRSEFDFMLAAGDDVTDEDVFNVAPALAWTIKVGLGPTAATFDVPSSNEIRSLLSAMAETIGEPAPASTPPV